MDISVLIPVFNEARNIVACIDSVRWAGEILVADSGSNDGTVELAEASGARVVQFQWNGQFPKKKNWALENIPWKNEWVLILDADERITAELAAEIQQELKQPRADGYFINRRFNFLGKWIRHCGYYPSWNLRLLRHSKGRYEKMHQGDTGSGDNEVHEHVVLNGKSAYLTHDMLHFAYPDIYTWMEKHNRYSNWEAQIETRGNPVGALDIGKHQNARRKLRTLSRQMPFRPTLRFIYSYVLQRGFLDGMEGYVFCRLLATYELMSVLKRYELRQKETRKL
jgi:glycosyltransferase involved in cell wall biosynthesis